MDQVRIVYDGKEVKLNYNDKLAHGVFIVSDNKLAEKNCAILKIELGENTHELELKQKVSKFEKTGILTTRILAQSFQYILKDYADKADIEELVKVCPPESKEALRTAYNITKMDNLQALEFLGGALDNKN